MGRFVGSMCAWVWANLKKNKLAPCARGYGFNIKTPLLAPCARGYGLVMSADRWLHVRVGMGCLSPGLVGSICAWVWGHQWSNRLAPYARGYGLNTRLGARPTLAPYARGYG